MIHLLWTFHQIHIHEISFGLKDMLDDRIKLLPWYQGILNEDVIQLGWMLVWLLEHYCRKCDSWRPTPDLKVGGAEHLKKHG